MICHSPQSTAISSAPIPQDAAQAVCSMHQFMVYPKTNDAVFKRQGGLCFCVLPAEDYITD